MYHVPTDGSEEKIAFFIIQWKKVNLLQQASGIINFGTLEHYSAHLRPSRDFQAFTEYRSDFIGLLGRN